jgi:four helix bundle protein
MAGVVKFEELLVWQKARGLTKAIYEVTRQSQMAHDHGLSNQMQRAAVSVMSTTSRRGSSARVRPTSGAS